MTILSRSELIEALTSGRPDDLLGTAESSWLDFKKFPYQLDGDRPDKGKFELCKDVAALANAAGGLLVVGISAEKQPDRAREVATSMHPFPQTRADVGRYYDTVIENLRPRVNVNHLWYRDPGRSNTQDLYYLVLEVEPVPEAERWVIVRRALNDQGMFVEGFAIPQRHGDRTVFVPPEDVYQLINQGLRARDLALEIPRRPPDDLAGEANASLDELQHLQGWNDEPVLFWQSIPPRRVDVVPGLHSSDGIRGALDYRRVLRQAGFNFGDTLGRLRVHDGGLLLSRSGRALWIRSDGLVTAGALATPELLCWAMEQRGLPQRLNIYTLTELTLEYFRIVDGAVIPTVPGTWRHRVVARRFRGDLPRLLGPGATDPFDFLSDASQASADTWDPSWAAVGDPERDAFEALNRIYALFGVDVKTNPIVRDDRIPIDAFRDSWT